MDRPGEGNMAMGALWFVGGALVSGITYFVASYVGGIVVVAYGAVIFGGLQFLLGLAQNLSYKAQVKEQERNLQKAQALHLGMEALLQSMISIAAADGKIDRQEIKMIADIYEKVTSTKLKQKEIKEKANKLKSEDFSITKSLRTIKGKLGKDIKEMIITASYFVSLADGNVSDQETHKIADIGASLGLSEKQMIKIIQKTNKKTLKKI